MVPEVAVAIEKAAAEPEFSADSTVEREVASVPAEAAVEAQLCFIDKVVEVDGCCSRCGSSNEPTTFQWCSYIQTRACPPVKLFGSGFCCIRSSSCLAAGCIC